MWHRQLRAQVRGASRLLLPTHLALQPRFEPRANVGSANGPTFGLDFCRQARIAVGEPGRAGVPAPTPTEIGGASGGASTAIVAVHEPGDLP